MEQQKLPNAGLIMAFGIISIISSCCYGIIGLLFAIVALVLAGGAKKTYLENPELYTNYGTVKTGRILAIIGLIVSIGFMAYYAYIINLVGWDVLMSGDQEAIMEAVQDKLQ